jgi:hypothetical protein
MALPSTSVSAFDSHEMARDSVEQALAHVARKATHGDVKRALTGIRRRDQMTMEYLAYYSAKHLAETLAEIDGTLRGAHLVCFQQGEEVDSSAPAVLLFVVSRKTPTLMHMVGSVASQMPGALAQVAGLDPECAAGFLDLQVIEQDEVNKGRGLGAALKSFWAPCLKVWER